MYMGHYGSFHAGSYSLIGLADQLEKKFKNKEIDDWPLMIQLGIVLTTCRSLLELLPKEEISKIFVDKRTIATLVRNIIESHDAIDFLCNHKKWAHLKGLNRDILGHYIARKGHKVMGDERGAELASKYLKLIVPKVDKKKLKNIENGESIFIQSRRERLQATCGDEAVMVERVISDLSSYVHAVPPGLWFENSFHEAFSDNERVRLMFCIWLQLTNFYLAKIATLVIENNLHVVTVNEELQRYIDRHPRIFAVE